MRCDDRIDCASHEIHDLEALRERPWLRELRIRLENPHGSAEHPLSSLEPLTGLRELEVVEVPRSRVADLAPLAGLGRLRRLDVSRTRVTDLEPLRGLTKLESLELRHHLGLRPLAVVRAAGARGARYRGHRQSPTSRGWPAFPRSRDALAGGGGAGRQSGSTSPGRGCRRSRGSKARSGCARCRRSGRRWRTSGALRGAARARGAAARQRALHDLDAARQARGHCGR